MKEEYTEIKLERVTYDCLESIRKICQFSDLDVTIKFLIEQWKDREE